MSRNQQRTTTATTAPAPAPAATSETQTETQAAEVVLVAMTRSADDYPAPHTADVHPDEVENFKVAGWVVAEQTQED